LHAEHRLNVRESDLAVSAFGIRHEWLPISTWFIDTRFSRLVAGLLSDLVKMAESGAFYLAIALFRTPLSRVTNMIQVVAGHAAKMQEKEAQLRSQGYKQVANHSEIGPMEYKKKEDFAGGQLLTGNDPDA